MFGPFARIGNGNDDDHVFQPWETSSFVCICICILFQAISNPKIDKKYTIKTLSVNFFQKKKNLY